MPRSRCPSSRRIDVTSPSVVSFVRLDAPRPLVTVTPSDPVWSGAALACPAGSIVRVQPPARATDVEIARVREACERRGAARCRIEPRAADDRVVLAARKEIAPMRSSSVREVVDGVASEARTHDRSALVAMLDELMSAEGL